MGGGQAVEVRPAVKNRQFLMMPYYFLAANIYRMLGTYWSLVSWAMVFINYIVTIFWSYWGHAGMCLRNGH